MEFKKEDVIILAEAVLENFTTEDTQSSDYCIYCFTHYGNYQKWYVDEDKTEPHGADCPVLIARDLLT